MTATQAQVPDVPARIPPCDGFTWTAVRDSAAGQATIWTVRGVDPGSNAVPSLLAVIRAAHTPEDLAHTVAGQLNGSQADKAALARIVRMLDDVAITWRATAEDAQATPAVRGVAKTRAHELENLARTAHRIVRELGALNV